MLITGIRVCNLCMLSDEVVKMYAVTSMQDDRGLPIFVFKETGLKKEVVHICQNCKDRLINTLVC